MLKERIIRLAILQAEKVDLSNRSKSRYRLGAVVFDKGVIFNTGRNSFLKTHPKSNSIAKNNNNGIRTHAIHAEFDAIVGCSIPELNGASILVVRIDAFGRLAMAKPCNSCMTLIRNSRIKSLYYSDGNTIVKEKV